MFRDPLTRHNQRSWKHRRLYSKIKAYIKTLKSQTFLFCGFLVTYNLSQLLLSGHLHYYFSAAPLRFTCSPAGSLAWSAPPALLGDPSPPSSATGPPEKHQQGETEVSKSADVTILSPLRWQEDNSRVMTPSGGGAWPPPDPARLTSPLSWWLPAEADVVFIRLL